MHLSRHCAGVDRRVPLPALTRASARFCISALFAALLGACTLVPSRPAQVPVETRPPLKAEGRAPQATPEAATPPLAETVAPEVAQPPVDAESQPPIRKPPPTAAPAASPAVVALLEVARAQAAAGDGEGAAASLERALRIEPKNPWLWHRLGVLRLQQGRPEEAVELAKKSNALAAGNLYLMAGNWELIAQARQALGDAAGAAMARETARRYRALAGGEPT